jgi:ATP-dependent Clp protease ATP-binding subunit ClpC
MFERFTPRARHVVVLAQEEARGLQHNYIGTEHVLLGLLGEPEGIAARALERFGMSLTGARLEVARMAGQGKKAPSGHIPFTPRAKKVLEYALREALSMNHNYIGTEHVLLGVIREHDGLAGQILRERAGDLFKVRTAVLDLIPTPPVGTGPRWSRRPDAGSPAAPGPGEELRTTAAVDTSLNVAARLAGAGPVGSHHLLLAALNDPNSAAVRALSALGLDLDQTRQALREVDVTGTDDEPPEEAGRRQMTIRITDQQLVLETADTDLLDLARAALQALGDPETASGTGMIQGDLPASVSLGNVWQALRDSLGDIRRRAASATGEPDTRPDDVRDTMDTVPDTADAKDAGGADDAAGDERSAS